MTPDRTRRAAHRPLFWRATHPGACFGTCVKTRSALLRATLALAVWLLASLAHAQAPAAPAPVVQAMLQGPAMDGTPFSLSTLRGRVVLVMFWSTGCAVCRDKMPELRQNAAGWRAQPFDLVLVSTDRRQQDLIDYERILTRTLPASQRFVQLWAGAPGFRETLGVPALSAAVQPTTFLIDKAGKVVERYSGRIPPEAWDRIADLL
jgi:thiol-disulfide isomerase/thioredoxin